MYQGSIRYFYQFVLRLLPTMKLSRHFIFIVIKAIFILTKTAQKNKTNKQFPFYSGLNWDLKNWKSLNCFFFWKHDLPTE
jgi:hypothetical protein